jgi:ATP-dependent helicase/DNAse subunit B
MVRECLKAGRFNTRLLVPSATLAEHLRNQLARDGAILRRNTVATLAHFLDEFPSLPPLPQPVELEAILLEAIRDLPHSEFAALTQRPGFLRSLAAVLGQLSSHLVEPLLLDEPLAGVYRRVVRILAERGLALRGQRIEQAARSAHGIENHTILIDGFFTFSPAERRFLSALANTNRVIVALPTGDHWQDVNRTRSELRFDSTVQTLPAAAGSAAASELVSAGDRAQEVLSTALEIAELAAKGTELRRIGVVLPNTRPYLGLVDRVFSRAAIPARFYFPNRLDGHPWVGFVRDVFTAVESRWEHRAVLRALRWSVTGLGGSIVGDDLEVRAIQNLPGSGLGFAPQSWVALTEWNLRDYSPTEAAEEFRKLRTLAAPAATGERSEEAAWHERQLLLAMDLLEQAALSTSTVLDPKPLAMIEFWRAVETNASAITLHERDSRRQVVHVMDAYEARQWDFDHLFVLGLVEGEFPSRPAPDPLLNEATKRRLGMPSLEERQTEERAVFAHLLTRAQQTLRLSYPRMNEKGDGLGPALLLTAYGFEQASVLPHVRHAGRPSDFREQDVQATGGYRAVDREWSASEFEEHLKCPFRHFARYGLKLAERPKPPEERLDHLVIGNLIHGVLEQWTQDPEQDIASLGDRLFERTCEEQRVPAGYRKEQERVRLLRNLRGFARNWDPPPAGWKLHTEHRFQFAFDDAVPVKGRIDRYDESPTGEIHAYDYKNSAYSGLLKKYPIQGPLYAMALGERVSKVCYVALREEAKYATLEGAKLADAKAEANVAIRRIVAEVRGGEVRVAPANKDACKYCEYPSVCRIQALEALRVIDDEEEPLEAAG